MKERFWSLFLLCTLLCFAVPSWAEPPSPSLDVQIDGQLLTLNWSEPAGASGYRLHYAAYPYNTGDPIYTAEMFSDTSFSVQLPRGAKYYGAVTAYDSTGVESAYSNIELIIIERLEAPVLTLETAGLLATLNWTEVSGASGYKLNFKPYPADESTPFNHIELGNKTSESYYLWEGAAYTLSITAYDSTGAESDDSNEESFIFGPPNPEWVDDDNDGFSEIDGDCDDGNASINPSAEEICGDGIDQNCSGQDSLCSVTLTALNISGGTQVVEGSTLQLSATASWSNGSTSNVTSSTTWSESSSAVTSVTNGLVSAGSVSSDTAATINASYTSGGITETASTSITVKNVATPSTVTSPTGRVWMDRNLGASQVATAYNDSAAYGDLYQWGRGTDGHEKRTSPTTSTRSSSDTPGHGSFITTSSSPYDWRSSQNDNLWQGVSGANNPCPSGFRLPTITEWEAERLTWSTNNQAGAFASPLNLVSAGYRDIIDGSIYDAGSDGNYWSSAVDGSGGRYLVVYSGGADTNYYDRAGGLSVRCLED